MTTAAPKYDPTAVPEVGDNETSRYAALHSTPAGWSSKPEAVVAHVYKMLAEERRAAQPDLAPPLVEIPLSFPVKNPEGEWVAIERGVLTARQTLASTRPSKWAATKLSGGALMDDFVSGGHAWQSAPDKDIWQALAKLVEQLDAPPAQVRELADTTGVLIALRCGVQVKAQELPYPAHLKEQP